MGDKSKIEWCDATWNPVTGCYAVSDGCDNCYAERMVRRFPQLHGFEEKHFLESEPLDLPVPFSTVRFHPDRLNQPLRWKKPRRIFVCSMGDLFHEDVKEDWIAAVFDVITRCQQHTFMLLTKRPERFIGWFDDRYRFLHPPGCGCNCHDVNGDANIDGGCERCEKVHVWPPPNLWLGVTAENQAAADQRIPVLLQTPAAKRFVSVEPCIGAVELVIHGHRMGSPHSAIRGVIDWIICGGESGPGARHMPLGAAYYLRDLCQAAGVPFFFKQWGEWCPESQLPQKIYDKKFTFGGDADFPNETYHRVGKVAAGCLLDGREWKEFPDNKGGDDAR